MLMTVAQYSESRSVSESTVKSWIRRLGLELQPNPADRRQRLLTIDQQTQLDLHGKVRQPHPEVEVQQPVEYRRSESVALTIAEHSILKAQLPTIRTAEENPLYQALAQQVQALQAQNAQAIQLIYQQGQAQRDTAAGIEAMDQLAIAQRATMRAANHHQLEQDLYNQTLTQLNLASRGIQVPQSQPTAQPVPQSQPAASPSPDWL